MAETPSSSTMSTGRQRIAELAKQAPSLSFTNLAQHITFYTLLVAYIRTRKDGAVGVDGQTAEAYAENLDANLQDLLNRAKSGTYRAPPVLRAHIPKGTGTETRPIGIPTFEDKVLQRAVVMTLEAVYEQDFHDCIGFVREDDARRVLEVLPKRFGKYGLTLHPDKTQLVSFQRPSQQSSAGNGETQSGSFDLLGFTHYWGRSRRGGWVIQRKTSTSRFSRAVKKIAFWCRKNRHQPVAEQHHKLSQKLRGHDAYFGITGNSRMLQKLRNVVTAVWRKWLARRRAGPLSWDRFTRVLERYPLPNARVVHSVYA